MVQYIFFRQGQADDVPALRTLIEAEKLPADDLRADEFIVAVHERDGRILGCGRVRTVEDGAELADLVVSAQLRAQGIGQFLVRRILERRREPIHIVTRRMDIRFFETLGFRAITEDDAPAWLRCKRDALLQILPNASLVFGVRDAGTVSF